MSYRQLSAAAVRRAAADVESAYAAPDHRSNDDERLWRDENGKPTYIGNFTKCLPHDANGFLVNPLDYEQWVRAIDTGDPRDFERLRVGPGPFHRSGDLARVPLAGNEVIGEPVLNWADAYAAGDEPGVRGWESQGAGLTYSMTGPDAHSVTMPPPPGLDSQELIAEMGENYWMALCRDVPFANWAGDVLIDQARGSLAKLWWFRRDRTDRLTGSTDVLPTSLRRRRILSENGTVDVDLQKVFRGAGRGVDVGPYVSQFMLVGSRGVNGRDAVHALEDGYVADGALRLDQRVRAAAETDYMTTWEAFLDVQNGAALGGREGYLGAPDPEYRFISRPRDLATYVHYDALYEAYLNACLVLLSIGAPVDPGLPFGRPDHVDRQTGFAQFGGPHILTLVTEVATLALKAVRYQKYNVHRRLRPEAVGGWLYQRKNNGDADVVARLDALENMQAAFEGASAIGAAVEGVNGADNWLLPMAFVEGSPAHPSYGAGHATVAGACVTILKAWFDGGAPLVDPDGNWIAFEADADGSALHDVGATLDRPLTIEGELNKVGANISIGRDWAGVHYYTDYLESFRMGEQIAVRVLEERKGEFSENFSLSVPLIDGTTVRI